MLLYTFPLVGVFAAAFFSPTNTGLTYTALGMALGPQILILLAIFSLCCCCLEKPIKNIGEGLTKIYSKIMQPKK